MQHTTANTHTSLEFIIMDELLLNTTTVLTERYILKNHKLQSSFSSMHRYGLYRRCKSGRASPRSAYDVPATSIGWFNWNNLKLVVVIMLISLKKLCNRCKSLSGNVHFKNVSFIKQRNPNPFRYSVFSI